MRGRPVHTIRVRAGAGGVYPVLIGTGLLDRLAGDLARGRAGRLDAPPARVAVFSDRHVAALYGRRLVASLRRCGTPADLLMFPVGEAHKTRETKARLEDRLAQLRFGRGGVIVALGGGVTGDLAGFVAATWHRGVALIHAPTSLIAMLDSSIGGKVGVDHPAGKNLVGAFHAPAAVYADLETLATLPAREFRCGLVEAVKCGVILDAGLFAEIEREAKALLRRDPEVVARLVRRTAAIKAGVVSRDERESGRRMLLNFGHTVGHAVEAASGYRIPHGEAVAVGVVVESRIARRLGLLEEKQLERIEAIVAALGFRVRLRQRRVPLPVLMEALSRDKKARAGAARFVLPSRIGRHAGGSHYAVVVPPRLLRALLAEAF